MLACHDAAYACLPPFRYLPAAMPAIFAAADAFRRFAADVDASC